MEKICDGKSVGVVIQDTLGRFALLKRANPPIAIAPAAGHIDKHGLPIEAAVAEPGEELGIILTTQDLVATAIQNRPVNNPCPRIGGGRHYWWVYAVTIAPTELLPSPDETKGAAWYTPAEVQALADRTRDYQASIISEEEWTASPGLEPVWLDFFTELGLIRAPY